MCRRARDAARQSGAQPAQQRAARRAGRRSPTSRAWVPRPGGAGRPELTAWTGEPHRVTVRPVDRPLWPRARLSLLVESEYAATAMAWAERAFGRARA